MRNSIFLLFAICCVLAASEDSSALTVKVSNVHRKAFDVAWACPSDDVFILSVYQDGVEEPLDTLAFDDASSATLNGRYIKPSTKYSLTLNSENHKEEFEVFTSPSPMSTVSCQLADDLVTLGCEIVARDMHGEVSTDSLPSDFVVSTSVTKQHPKIRFIDGRMVFQYSLQKQTKNDQLNVVLTNNPSMHLVGSPVLLRAAPQGLQVSDIRADSALVSWTPVSPVAGSPLAGYHVRFWPDVTGSPAVSDVIAEADATSARISGLAASSKYRMTIAAVYAKNEEGLVSAQVPFTTVPAAPASLSLEHVERTHAEVSWAQHGLGADLASSPVTRFTVHYSLVDSNGVMRELHEVELDDTTAASAMLDGLLPSNHYSISAVVANEIGESPMSDPIVIDTNPTLKTSVACVPQEESSSAVASTVLSASRKQVFTCTITPRDMLGQVCDADKTDFTVKSLRGHVSAVTRVGDNFEFTYTAPGKAKVDDVSITLTHSLSAEHIAGSPVLVTVASMQPPSSITFSDLSATSATVSWVAPIFTDGLTHYRVEVDLGKQEADSFELTVGAESTSVQLHNLQPSSLYSVSVVSVYGDKSTSPSDSVSLFTQPVTPVNVAPIATGRTSITVQWESPASSTTPTDGALVNLYSVVTYWEKGSTDRETVKSSKRANKLQIKGLEPSTTYLVSVQTANVGGLSAPSESIEVHTTPAPESIMSCPYEEINTGETMDCTIAPRDIDGNACNAEPGDFAISAKAGSVGNMRKDSLGNIRFTYYTPSNVDILTDSIRAHLAGGSEANRLIAGSPLDISIADEPVIVPTVSNVTASAAVISWTAPRNLYGISAYRLVVGLLESSSAPFTVDVPLEKTQLHLDSLVPSSLYYVQVLPVQASDNSVVPVDAKSELMTLPLPPALIEYDSSTRTSITVVWTNAAQSGNLPMTNLILSVKGPRGFARSMAVDPRAPSATVTGLNAATTYKISMVYENAAGRSASSTTFQATTSPTVTSALGCSQNTLRYSDVITCTLTALDEVGQPVDQVASDFVVSVDNGSLSPLVPSADGSAMTFTYTAPTGTDSANIRAFLATGDKKEIAGSPLTLTIYDLPSPYSVLNCEHDYARYDGDVMHCTITALGWAIEPITSLASDFLVTTNVGSVSKLITEDDGFSWSFTVRPPVHAHAEEMIMNVTLAATGTLIKPTPLVIPMYGFPSTQSTLECRSDGVRVGKNIICTVHAFDIHGNAVKAHPKDFTARTLHGTLGPFLNVDATTEAGTDYLKFRYTAPQDGQFDMLDVTLAGTSLDILNSPAHVKLYGHPTNASELTCEKTSLRVDEITTCTLHFRNDNGPIAARFNDFKFMMETAGMFNRAYNADSTQLTFSVRSKMPAVDTLYVYVADERENLVVGAPLLFNFM